MSVGFIRSNVVRKVVSVVCLLTFPAVAQQANTGLQMQATPSTSQQPAASGASNRRRQQCEPAASVDAKWASSAAAARRRLPNAPEAEENCRSPRMRIIPNPRHCCQIRLRGTSRADVPPPAFTNAPKIEQLVQNGKLMLSLNDAIAIALADNLDIAVARYNLPIADTDILRTKAGGTFLGVNSGVVANTPGGGQGGVGSGISGAGAGGTTAGAGGAGVGAGGFVGSTSGAGPQPDSFDPVLSGTFSIEQAASPTNFGLLSGLGGTGATIPVSTAHTTVGDLSYFQGFSPGTALTVSFNNQRQSTNGSAQTFNPVLDEQLPCLDPAASAPGIRTQPEFAPAAHSPK